MVIEMKDLGLMVNEVEMDSLELAKITEKEHKNIMRDIRNEIDTLGAEIGQLIFEPTSYIDKSNREKPCYTFGKKGAMQLALKYDAVTRYKVIKKIEELEQDIKQLNQDNKQLYNIAVSDEEQQRREYEAKKVRYSIRNLRNVLWDCTYKNIEDTVNGIVEFHGNELKTKDRYTAHVKKDKTKYKQYIRKFLGEILDNIYNQCNCGDLRVIALRMSKDVVYDRLKTTNRSVAQKLV